jgi:hypothetical protein
MSFGETPAGQPAQINLWSVTTLLKLGLGTSPALVNWAVNTAAAYAIDNQKAWAPLATADRDAAIKVIAESRYQKSGKAAARGSDVHRAAEQLALGQEPDVDEHILPYVHQYRRFLDTHEPVFKLAEAPVYNLTQHYAGTTDGIMEIAGRDLLFDLKTTDKDGDAKQVGLLSEKREVNYARYYVYDPSGHHEPMPPVDGAVCIVISPFDCRVVPVRIDDTVFRAFLHVRECARWQVETSRHVLGPEITAPARSAA